MRKAVPMLNNSLTTAEFLDLIPSAFQSVVFGTIANGRPYVKEVDLSYLDKIYDQHPEMLEINKTDSERRKLLRPFEITPTDGFVYDLRQTPIFQKSFTF